MDALKELNRYMKSDSKLSLNGMAVSLGINFAIAFGIFMVFNILRPNHSRKYIYTQLLEREREKLAE